MRKDAMRNQPRFGRASLQAVAALALVGLVAACAEKEVILQGDRYPVDTDLAILAPVDEGKPIPPPPPAQPAGKTAPISLPGASANLSWTHRGGNPQHLSPHGALSAQPQLVWSAAVGTGNSQRARIEATPVAADGRIFSMDAHTQLTAVSTSGQTLWSVDLAADYDRDGGLSGGGLAYGEGKLFVTTAFGELLGVDPASGGVIWRQRLQAPAAGSPTVSGGAVYAIGRDGSAWSVRASDGKVLWQVPGAASTGGFAGGAAPAASGDRVIFGYPTGDLGAHLARSGVQLWVTTVAGERGGRSYASMSNITGDPVIAGGTVYVGTSGGKTAAFSLNSGQLLWSATEGALNPPLVVGGSVFVVSDESRLVRLEAGSGKVIWSVPLPYFTEAKPKKHQAIVASYGPVLAGGRLAVASSDGVLRLFDPRSGQLVGSAQIPGGAASAPILAAGMLLVMGGDGQLHAFR